jgi:predicted anti-sigma-YlaC factor YlaD
MEEGKMSHPRFETMLFERTDLKGSDRLALEQHLQECKSCQRLASNWSAIESRFRKAPMVTPMAGFTTRFQARLVKKRQRRREWVMIAAGLGVISILVLLMILFGSGLLALLSPGIRYLLKSLTSLMLFGGVMQIFTDFMGLLFARVVANISPGSWLTYSALFSGLAAIWLSSVYKLNLRKSLQEVQQ